MCDQLECAVKRGQAVKGGLGKFAILWSANVRCPLSGFRYSFFVFFVFFVSLR